jgi:transcriptional regulator with XRE-family HTH domain
MSDMDVGEEIRRAREAADLTQQELATKSGLHRTYINMVEKGRKRPTVDVFARICDALAILPSKMLARIERRQGRR